VRKVYFQRTKAFHHWLKKLKDKTTILRIADAVESAESGNFQKSKPIKTRGAEGIFEIVVDFGPGYRLYYCREGSTIYWLLIGGINDSQERDVEHAIALRRRGREFGYDKI
jgi:putative addiction module killer protein